MMVHFSLMRSMHSTRSEPNPDRILDGTLTQLGVYRNGSLPNWTSAGGRMPLLLLGLIGLGVSRLQEPSTQLGHIPHCTTGGVGVDMDDFPTCPYADGSRR